MATQSWKNRSSLDTLIKETNQIFLPHKIFTKAHDKVKALVASQMVYVKKKIESIKGEQIQWTETITDYQDFW